MGVSLRPLRYEAGLKYTLNNSTKSDWELRKQDLWAPERPSVTVIKRKEGVESRGSVAKCSPSVHELGSKPNLVKKKED